MYGNGAKISAHILRRVWRCVTQHPQATVRAMARDLGYASTSTVRPALEALRGAGYIDYVDGTERARTILVPFVAVERDRNGHR